MNLDTQLLIEKKFSRHQKNKLIRKELQESPEIMNLIGFTVSKAKEWSKGDYYESKNKRLAKLDTSILEEFYMDLIGSIALQEHAKFTQVVGMVSHHIKNMEIKDAIKTTGELIAIAVEADLVDMIPARISISKSMEIISRIRLKPETLELIKQYKYLPPLIVPPQEVTSNRGSGYYTIESDSLILKDNHHNFDICLDHINRSNSVAFSLNDRVIRNIRDNREHLDSPKVDESQEEYELRVKSFEKMEKDSMHIFALMVNTGNKFYLTNKYDKRGRTYQQGYHISSQGNCYRKAILELADKEIVPIEE